MEPTHPPPPPPPPPPIRTNPPPPQVVYVYPAPPPRPSYLWLWIILGVLGGIFVLGILAAIAIPSFMSYQKKAKRSEAELALKVIEKGAHRHAMEVAAFPEGDTGLTPPRPCCEDGVGRGKCTAEAMLWSDPVWQQLDFYLDEPHFFQYSYRGTATAFVATAVGDLDCDGDMITHTLEGRFVDGVPVFTMSRPTSTD